MDIINRRVFATILARLLLVSLRHVASPFLTDYAKYRHEACTHHRSKLLADYMQVVYTTRKLSHTYQTIYTVLSKWLQCGSLESLVPCSDDRPRIRFQGNITFLEKQANDKYLPFFANLNVRARNLSPNYIQSIRFIFRSRTRNFYTYTLPHVPGIGVSRVI